MSDEKIFATYLIEIPYHLEKAATIMAGEQSTGTFVAVPGETPELKARHGAEVVSIEELDSSDTPSLPGVIPPNDIEKPVYRRAIVKISFPLINF